MTLDILLMLVFSHLSNGVFLIKGKVWSLQDTHRFAKESSLGLICGTAHCKPLIESLGMISLPSLNFLFALLFVTDNLSSLYNLSHTKDYGTAKRNNLSRTGVYLF